MYFTFRIFQYSLLDGCIVGGSWWVLVVGRWVVGGWVVVVGGGWKVQTNLKAGSIHQLCPPDKLEL